MVSADTIFDCTSATSNFEQLICSDQNLADLNAISNQLFLKSKQIDTKNSSDINRSLYFNLRKCNDEQECLNNAYQDAVRSYQALIAQNTPIVVEEKNARVDNSLAIDSQSSAENEQKTTGVYTQASQGISSWFDSFTTGDWVIVFLILLFWIYFLPSFVAFSRGHRNRWVILIVNIVFGCTFFGWVIALIWASNKIDDPIKGGVKHDSQPHDPVI